MQGMPSPLLARFMVTAVAAGQGITPLFIDLNRTHATNPLWTGHARFHVVEQTFGLTAFAIVEVVMLWWITPGSAFLFRLATLLTSIPIVAFVIATFGRKLYGGTLHDPNGIRPVAIRLGDTIHEIDVNIVLVLAAGLVLISSVLIF
jgi:hypothetical protein